MKVFSVPNRLTRLHAVRCFALLLAIALLLSCRPMTPANQANAQDEVQGTSGVPDPAFGSNGKVFSDLLEQKEICTAVAVQPDGKIIAAGYTATLVTPGFGDFLIARYHPDGSLDTSFGVGGQVTTDFFHRPDQARALALQNDGKIVVGGYASFRGNDDNTEFAFALARYNPDGSPDLTFGSAGKLTTDLAGDGGNTYPTPETINDLLIQGDGKIVVTGTAHAGEFTDFATVRYNADGTLDNSFGIGGRVLTDLSGALGLGVSNDFANAIALQSDGKLVIAGKISANGSDFALARYNPDGSLDLSFGTGGKILPDAQGRLRNPNALALQNDGKLLLAGSAIVDGRDAFAMIRFDEDGRIDASFGTAGIVITGFAGAAASLQALALQSDGRIIAAGTILPDGAAADFALAYYQIDGSLDASFGDGGKWFTDFSGRSDTLSALVVQSDNKILVAGTSADASGNTDFAFARYLGGEAAQGIRYDICIQDAADFHYLEVNSSTGDYQLTRCDQFWLRGKATMTREGNILTLTDGTTDRTVEVSINLKKRKATVVIRTPELPKPTKIKDKNIDNNSCSCK